MSAMKRSSSSALEMSEETHLRPSAGREQRKRPAIIIDDHQLFALALQPILEDLGIEVLHIATTGREGLAAVSENPPDLVFVDLTLPDTIGTEVAREILEKSPEVRVLVLSATTDARAVRDTLRLGVHAYLTKDMSIDRFKTSIRAALDDQVVIPHQLAPAAAGNLSPEEQGAALLASQLTVQERRVLQLLVQGLGGREIARQLSISPNTARTHIQNILSKLQVHSRLEAAAFAIRYRLVDSQGEIRATPY